MFQRIRNAKAYKVRDVGQAVFRPNSSPWCAQVPAFQATDKQNA